MLRLQSDHAVYLLDNHPDIPRRIIQGLTQSLTGHLSRTQNDSVKDVSILAYDSTYAS